MPVVDRPEGWEPEFKIVERYTSETPDLIPLTHDCLVGLQGPVMHQIRRYCALLMEAEELRRNCPEIKALVECIEKRDASALSRFAEAPHDRVERAMKYEAEFKRG